MGLVLVLTLDALVGVGCLAATVMRHRGNRAAHDDETRRHLLRRFARGELDLADYEAAIALLPEPDHALWRSVGALRSLR